MGLRDWQFITAELTRLQDFLFRAQTIDGDEFLLQQLELARIRYQTLQSLSDSLVCGELDFESVKSFHAALGAANKGL